MKKYSAFYLMYAMVLFTVIRFKLAVLAGMTLIFRQASALWYNLVAYKPYKDK